MMRFVCLVLFFIFVFPNFLYAKEPMKGIWYGSHVFGNARIIKAAQELLQYTELNTIVIDYKDDHGTVLNGERFRALAKPFKMYGARIICRVVTLKDNVWARTKGRAYALKSKTDSENLWRDYKGNTYLDPSYREVADYHAQISIRAIQDGCEMLNYDYIRLPSGRDGRTSDTRYGIPPKGSPRKKIDDDLYEKRRVMQAFVNGFVADVRQVYPHTPLAVSIFGYACYGREPHIGQYLDDFARHGLVISCMAYPSHYSCNDGAPDPNTIPYEIYLKTHQKARVYLRQLGLDAVFMPWLQGFDFHNINGCGLGVSAKGNVVGISGKRGRRALYASNPINFRKQIAACNELGIHSWLIWPSKAAFENRSLYLSKKK